MDIYDSELSIHKSIWTKVDHGSLNELERDKVRTYYVLALLFMDIIIAAASSWLDYPVGNLNQP